MLFPSLTSPTRQLPEHSLTRSHGGEGLGVPTELVDLGQLLPRWIRRAISVYVESLLAPPPHVGHSGLMRTHVPVETEPRGGEVSISGELGSLRVL